MNRDDLQKMAQREQEREAKHRCRILCCASTPCLSSGGTAVEEALKNTIAEAGLKADDQIIEFDGNEIKNRDDLRDALKKVKAGDKIKIVVKRDDEEEEFELELGYYYKPAK